MSNYLVYINDEHYHLKDKLTIKKYNIYINIQNDNYVKYSIDITQAIFNKNKNKLKLKKDKTILKLNKKIDNKKNEMDHFLDKINSITINDNDINKNYELFRQITLLEKKKEECLNTNINDNISQTFEDIILPIGQYFKYNDLVICTVKYTTYKSIINTTQTKVRLDNSDIFKKNINIDDHVTIYFEDKMTKVIVTNICKHKTNIRVMGGSIGEINWDYHDVLKDNVDIIDYLKYKNDQFEINDEVKARYNSGYKLYSGKIKEINNNGIYIEFTDGDKCYVPPSQIYHKDCNTDTCDYKPILF
jgi:hypothetical protein